MFVESSVGRDCDSRIEIWCIFMVAKELPKEMYAVGCEKDEV
jgi:hypothetical protein